MWMPQVVWNRILRRKETNETMQRKLGNKGQCNQKPSTNNLEMQHTPTRIQSKIH